MQDAGGKQCACDALAGRQHHTSTHMDHPSCTHYMMYLLRVSIR